MVVVNMLDAKTRLSQLVEAVESGAEDEIIIARNGKPAARLSAVTPRLARPIRLGLAQGLFEPPQDPHADDDAILEMFGLKSDA
jgi:prevent-host-death family protein